MEREGTAEDAGLVGLSLPMTELQLPTLPTLRVDAAFERLARTPSASTPVVDAALWALAAVGVAVLAALPYLTGTHAVLTAGDGLVLGLFALSVNVLVRTAGLVTFGHAAYFGLGAYTMTIVVNSHGWPPLAGLAFTPVLTAAVAFLSGFVLLRGRELYFALLTLGVGQLFEVTSGWWSGLTGGPRGLTFVVPAYPGFVQSNDDQYWFTLAVVLLCAGLLYGILRSPFGDAVRAVRENRQRAEFSGLSVKRYELAALVLAGAFAGVAGALFAMFELHTEAGQLDWTTSFQGLIAALVGGITTHLGPLVGGLFYTFLQDWLSPKTHLWDLFVGVTLVVVVLVLPAGMTGALRTLLGVALAPIERALRRKQPAPSPSEGEPQAVHLPSLSLGASVEAPRNLSARPPVLVTHALTKRFGGLVALRDVSISVREGSVHAVIGPNGAGKTTFFNVLTGVLRADGGSFEFAGRSAGGVAPWRLVRRGMGRSFQQPRLFWALSALANSLLPEAAVRGETRRPWGSHGPALYEQALGRLGRVGLESFRDMPAEGLSHGDQRTLELATALAVEPHLLLLDEPTSGLSPAETAVAVELIGRVARERGLTVLFIEHDMSVVFSVADRITVLHRGAVLAEGTPDEIRAHPEVQRAYLGTAEAV